MSSAETDKHRLREAHRLDDLVNGHPEHVDEALPQLLAILDATKDPQVTRAAVEALGHAWHPTAAAALLERIPLDSSDPGVRLALAQALPCGVDEPGELKDRVLSVLVRLTRDLDPGVRDWAAFGLGELPARTPQALDALAALLGDPDRATRCEALLALAAAGDARALPVLHRRLGGDDDVTRLELQAAAALAAPELHTALQRLAEDWAEDDDEFTDVLGAAVARTAPGAAGNAQQVEREVLEQVRELLPEPAEIALTGAYPHTVLVITDRSEDLDLPLWVDLETPDTYPVGDVLSAVRGSLTRPSE